MQAPGNTKPLDFFIFPLHFPKCCTIMLPDHSSTRCPVARRDVGDPTFGLPHPVAVPCAGTLSERAPPCVEFSPLLVAAVLPLRVLPEHSDGLHLPIPHQHVGGSVSLATYAVA
jgi:hypothetical protein